jgi:hypothetical protein
MGHASTSHALAGRLGRLHARLRANRNALLFAALSLIIVLLPLFDHTWQGEITFALVNMLIIGVAATYDGSSRNVFWLAWSFAAPALALSVLALVYDLTWASVVIWMLGATVHALTLSRLLREIFSAGEVTRERLFGCANVYLLLGVLWCYLYATLEYLSPNSMPGFGPRASLHAADTIYFSFNIVTGVGLTDVVPATKSGKALVLVEQLCSVLYMAFVISRLVGLYVPQKRGA